jgi:hypothetical protein
MSLHSLHRRLDRIDGSHDELPGLVESLDRAGQKHAARQAAWTSAGHPGTPPGKRFSALASNASHRSRQLRKQAARQRRSLAPEQALGGAAHVA